jgi:hypothetical protein
MEKEIDRILNKVKNELDFAPEHSANFEDREKYNEYNRAFILLKTKNFIGIERNRYALFEKGLEVLEVGGWKMYQQLLKEKKNREAEKEIIDFEKSKIDLVLAKKMLEEFPKTKWFARIGFIIGIVLMLKELYILIWK